jgi:hypothetical protein
MYILEKLRYSIMLMIFKLILPLQGLVPKRNLPLRGISTIELDKKYIRNIK